MARPRKDEDTRRTETIAFRLSVPDRLRLEYAAVAEDLKASELARRRTLAGNIVIIPSRSLPFPVFDEIRRINVNLLQLGRVIGEAGPVPPELARATSLIGHTLDCSIEQAPRRRRRSNKDAETLLVADIRFRVTAAEYRAVSAKAEAAGGLTVSEYARRQSLAGQVVMVEHDRVLDPAAFEQLQAAGIIVNRHARIANQTGRISDELRDDCRILQQIIIALGLGEHAALPAQPKPPAPAPGGP